MPQLSNYLLYKGAVADTLGQTTTQSRSFTTDTSAPNLAIITPANNSFTNDSTPEFAITFSDLSGIDTTSFFADFDGTDLSTSFTVTGSGAAFQPLTALSAGAHQFMVTIADNAGNISSKTTSFEIDTT